MRTTIRGIENEILVQTVTLCRNPADPAAVILFRCYHCGTAITRIQGEVQKIEAGLVPSSDVTIIHQCHECKENYAFQTGKGQPDVTSLTLTAQPNRSISLFYCVVCRTQLGQYSELNKDKISLLPWNTQQSLPTSFTCFNPSCNRKYLLNEVVSTVLQ